VADTDVGEALAVVSPDGDVAGDVDHGVVELVGYGDMGPYGGGELRGYPTPRTDPANPC